MERTYPLFYEMEKYSSIEIVNLGMMLGTVILHVIIELEET